MTATAPGSAAIRRPNLAAAILLLLLALLRPLSQASADEQPRFEVVSSFSASSGAGEAASDA